MWTWTDSRQRSNSIRGRRDIEDSHLYILIRSNLKDAYKNILDNIKGFIVTYWERSDYPISLNNYAQKNTDTNSPDHLRYKNYVFLDNKRG